MNLCGIQVSRSEVEHPITRTTCVRATTSRRWPLPADLSDAELERRLFPYSRGEARRAVPQPDWAYVHAELRRKGVTLSLLWEEYRGVHPDGYGYSRYCELYTSWEGKLSPVMRQRHPAGERLFVDYAGQTVDVICPKTGEVRTAQIFVAALGVRVSLITGQSFQ